MAARQPLIVIVGPTAAGKTALALDLARRFNGEVICADSRTVYRGLDIGTAKPSKLERKAVRHHLLDVVEPDGYFSAAEFKKLANAAITEIAARGKLPIMAGGSGLYIDAVLFNYSFAPKALAIRRDPVNPRHLSRAVVVKKDALRPDTLIIGLRVPGNVIKQRVAERVETMFSSGLVEEAKRLAERYGWAIRPLQAPGYKAVRKYLNGDASLAEAKQEFIRNDLNLAKRQLTWFRRNKSIHYVSDPNKAVEIVTTFLNKIR